MHHYGFQSYSVVGGVLLYFKYYWNPTSIQLNSFLQALTFASLHYPLFIAKHINNELQWINVLLTLFSETSKKLEAARNWCYWHSGCKCWIHLQGNFYGQVQFSLLLISVLAGVIAKGTCITQSFSYTQYF